MLSTSNPQLSIMDMLSKLSHDNDAEVAHNSIFAMGVVAAGTNNARLAAMLRQLAQYYNKDASNLFMVRLAQVSRFSPSTPVSSCGNTRSRDDPYCTSRENSLELIELSSINVV